MTEVSVRRIVFSVHATDGQQDIGTGTHERVLIDLAAFTARLAGAGKGGPPELPHG